MRKSPYHKISARERTKLLNDSRPSAIRAGKYVSGDASGYLGAPMEIFGASAAPIQTFDDGLLRHDLHVLFYTRNALVGYANAAPQEGSP